MRIISGRCRGRKLVPLQDRDIRPTSDRTREAVFNMIGPKIRDATVLDLFAGTGALGIEALSRGARHATFVDLNSDVVRQNLSLCRIEKQSRIVTADLVGQPIPDALLDRAYDMVFIDPPYYKGYVETLLNKPRFTHLLADRAWIIVESSCKENIKITIPGLDIFKQRKYSKTNISIINRT